MMLTLLIFAALGHVILWVAAVNRLHAVRINRRLMHFLTAVCGIALIAVPLLFAWDLFGDPNEWVLDSGLAWFYAASCAVVCIYSIAQWWYLRTHPERQALVIANHTTTFRPQDQIDRPLTARGLPAWLARLPFNEALEIHVHEKELMIPRLSGRHDGLRIAHLSDLHMSGRINKHYFEEVVAQTNRLEPDIVAITGDLVEQRKCLGWIPDTLGRLQAGVGIYYVLGNHDLRVGAGPIHAVMNEMGLIHVGSRWIQLNVRDEPVILAGNELPWFGPAADLNEGATRNSSGLLLRVLLSHSPDQFGWAQEHDFDLMLAGHNHGGQVRMPIVGAILAPSLHGVRYSAGAFRSDNTVLHVSRGTSSLTPMRFNCPPEIALLILRAKT
jgi:predicted MPP superfamily phosphohydrolase